MHQHVKVFEESEVGSRTGWAFLAEPEHETSVGLQTFDYLHHEEGSVSSRLIREGKGSIEVLGAVQQYLLGLNLDERTRWRRATGISLDHDQILPETDAGNSVCTLGLFLLHDLSSC